MRKLIPILAAFIALPLAAQTVRSHSFASDYQTIPVVSNVRGIGGTFQSYVALLNPTSSGFTVTASLYDTTGTKRDASITLAAGELRTYANFLADVFNYTGGGALTLRSPQAGNRFVVSTEITSNRYNTMIPVLEFAGTSSPSFALGVNVDTNTRTNVGCFNQSDAANRIRATVYDATGKQNLGTFEMNLSANAWGQTSITSIVSGGYVQFEPQDNAVCYAVVVDNSTNDGRFINAAEYKP
jgi:hypothetical protein